MEEIGWSSLARHDIVVLAEKTAMRLSQETAPLFSGERQKLVQEFFGQADGLTGIPGIVRREVNLPQGMVAVGFVPSGRYEGQRIRIGALVQADEIVTVHHPEDILQMMVTPRNACMELLQRLAALSQEKKWELGVLGSAGLEIYTGQPYTDAASDIDLLMPGFDRQQIQEAAKAAEQMAVEYSIPIDLEVSLSNGYGIKAAELFSESKLILGKSLRDVALLPRQEVLSLLG